MRWRAAGRTLSGGTLHAKITVCSHAVAFSDLRHRHTDLPSPAYICLPNMGARDCCATIWAFLLPPVGVFLVSGCGVQLCINILLTLLGFIPGIIHALIVVCATDNPQPQQVVQVVHTQAPPPQQVIVHQPMQPQQVPAGYMPPPPTAGYPAVPPPGTYPAAGPPAGYPQQYPQQ